MDPNTNLSEQRRIVDRMLNGHEQPEDGCRLAELSAALDEWMSSGGFLPDAWCNASNGSE
jgi:hypothetical protein